MHDPGSKNPPPDPSQLLTSRRHALEAAGIGEIHVHVAERVGRLSPLAARLFGLGNEAVSLGLEALQRQVLPEDRRALADVFARGAGAVFDLRLRTTTPSGGSRWVRLRGSCVEGEGHDHVFALVHDAEPEARHEQETTALRAEIVQQRDALHSHGERSQAASARLLAAQEEERHRIARELHDEVGQTLTACILNLELLPNAADPALTEVVADLRRLLGQVRDMSLELRPPILDRGGLGPALRWLVERFGAAARLRCRLQSDGLDGRLDGRVEITAFRIVQEALTNIARHAQARRADVTISCTAAELAIRISDDGVGFAGPDRGGEGEGDGQGLLGMNERARLIGGRCELISLPGVGSLVLARLPLVPAA